MTNKTAKFVTIKGLWFDGDGYRKDLVRQELEVMLDGGKIYDAELGYRGELTIKDGDLFGWGDAYFSPWEGEIGRIVIGV